jgi:hypothetical protein
VNIDADLRALMLTRYREWKKLHGEEEAVILVAADTLFRTRVVLTEILLKDGFEDAADELASITRAVMHRMDQEDT